MQFSSYNAEKGILFLDRHNHNLVSDYLWFIYDFRKGETPKELPKLIPYNTSGREKNEENNNELDKLLVDGRRLKQREALQNGTTMQVHDNKRVSRFSFNFIIYLRNAMFILVWSDAQRFRITC